MNTLARAGVTLLSIALIAVGAFVAWSGILGFQRLEERRLWPKVSATILEDRITRAINESDSGRHDLEIHQLRLRYRVAGRDYETELAATQADLFAQSRTGMAGENLTVIYNPLKPQEIHKTTNFWPVPLIILGVLLSVLGFAIVIVRFQRREISGRS